MKLWIRSQDKKLLCKIDSLFIGEELYKRKGKYRIMANNGWLGAYNTLERALEVLDEIQNLITRNNETVVVRLSNEDFIKQMPVYEMPKE